MNKSVLAVIFTVTLSTAFSQRALKSELKQFVHQFFDAMNSKDTTYLRSQFMEGTGLSTVIPTDEETLLLSSDVTTFLSNMYEFEGFPMEEKVSKIKVHVDKDLAQVWMKYEFYFDGKLHHTGHNSFGLVRLNGKWLIRDLIDSYNPVENKKGGQ